MLYSIRSKKPSFYTQIQIQKLEIKHLIDGMVIDLRYFEILQACRV